MIRIVVILSCLLLLQCSMDRAIAPISEYEIVNLEKFQMIGSASKVMIADEQEPGEKLLLCVTFLDKDSKKAWSNQKVSFYHTSTNGDYEPSNPADETTARLNGTAITNESGEIYVKTILPGDYGNSTNNRHIHTTVYGASPEAYDILFNQCSGRIGRFMDSGNDQMFFADLKKTKDNELACFVTIEAKNPKNGRLNQ